MFHSMTRRELGKIAIAGAALAGLGGLVSSCGEEEGSSGVLSDLPDFGIPAPVDYIRTNWSRDPLAYCSYSYLAPTAYGIGIREMLAKPFGRVAICGEATSRIDPATVHGAIEAGRTAAGKVIGELRTGSRIAIVGAGACGLACAGELIQAGMEPILLEASDRVGGRVKSGELDGAPVELGASWIHGIEGNTLTGLAEENGVDVHEFFWDFDFPVPGQGPVAAIGEKQLAQAIASFDPRASGARTLTLDDLLPWRWGLGLEWAVQYEVAQEYGADPGKLAALATWEGGWFKGNDGLLGSPYVNLIDGLSRGAETRLGFRADRVVQQSRGVSVFAGDEEVKVDAALVTVPIGVLKAGTIKFEPGLPAGTRAAIDGLGAGLLDKLWLAFEEPFWDEGSEGFQWIDPQHPGRWGGWVNAVPVDGKPFLLTLSGGNDAMRLARQSDLEIVSGAMGALAKMFGRAT